MQAPKRYPEVPREDSVWRDAERIFLSSEPYLFGDEHVAELKGDGQLPQPVELIDGEMVSWYGVRAIAGLNYLADLRENRLQLSGERKVAQGLLEQKP